MLPNEYVTFALGNIEPVVVTLAPTFNSPLIPAPPATTSAPVVVLVLAVPELATKLPPTISTPNTSSVEVSTTEFWNVTVPATFKLPPIYASPLIPTPPSTIIVPVDMLVLETPALDNIAPLANHLERSVGLLVPVYT